MKRDTTADRLKQIMSEKNLRQIDILNRTVPLCKKYGVKMNKSDISQYVSGKVEPSQEKLVILGMALGVQEAWLMGLDVPKERKDSAKKAEEDFEVFRKYSVLNKHDQEIILKLMDFMIEKY